MTATPTKPKRLRRILSIALLAILVLLALALLLMRLGANPAPPVTQSPAAASGGLLSSFSYGPIAVAALAFLAVVSVAVGIWRMQRPLEGVDARVKEYGLDEGVLLGADEASAAGAPAPRKLGLLRRLDPGASLARNLSLSGLPLTASEYALVILAAAALGFLLGRWRLGNLGGLALALVFAYLPLFYLKAAIRRRQRAFTEQLPDVLDLLTGALRAGYGLAQAMQLLARELPPPASVEFARVVRMTNLGASFPAALEALGERIGTDDVNLVVTTITVQYQIGGNLADTLDSVGETVRDRLRIQRQIRVLTAQQRLTGYLLAGLPLVLAFLFSMLRADYFEPFTRPGLIFLPVSTVLLQLLGFLVMRRIVDIEV